MRRSPDARVGLVLRRGTGGVATAASIACNLARQSAVFRGWIAYELARVWRLTGGAEGLPNVEFGTKTKRVPKTAIVRLLEPKAS